MVERKTLWQRPQCGKRFTTENQWHSYGKFELEDFTLELRGCFEEVYRVGCEAQLNRSPSPTGGSTSVQNRGP